jgi:hypothetical protein
VRDASVLSPNFWSYIDVYDLADAIVLAAESDLPGHEVFYIASPDNVGNRPSSRSCGDTTATEVEVKKPLPREDSSGISAPKPRGCSATLPNAPGVTTSTRTAGPCPARKGVCSTQASKGHRPPRKGRQDWPILSARTGYRSSISDVHA